ncbi:MAG: AbrB/MazE/SpoVT family DNA-binding domain-containing protein [Candidatus Hadarchaeum sp.]|uniref:AbrB/MazE/SpoVT family DNA-binding domain-containing protein n=1 Tax=Candidatus Hadarchaeum sp. TaxID=2883567 RepID=UPI003D0EE94C
MTLAVTKTSIKGQLVIPKEIRRELGIKEGQLMLVYAAGDRIILKKVEAPEPGLFSMLAEPIRAKARERRVTRKDVERAIREIRGHAE